MCVMIISFSGRKGSGKTVLRMECLKRGYQRISWADRLKELVGELYHWDRHELDDPILKEELLSEPVVYDESAAKRLEDLIDATHEVKRNFAEFTTRRKALQHIGTDVLREYDTEFHVNRSLKRLIQKSIT